MILIAKRSRAANPYRINKLSTETSRQENESLVTYPSQSYPSTTSPVTVTTDSTLSLSSVLNAGESVSDTICVIP